MNRLLTFPARVANTCAKYVLAGMSGVSHPPEPDALSRLWHAAEADRKEVLRRRHQ